MAQIWAKQAKIRSKISFFFIHFPKFVSLVFLEVAYSDSLEHCLTTSRGKTHEKSFGVPSWVPNQGFCHFPKVASLVFFDIAQDCCLGLCLTSRRAETPLQKMFYGPNRDQNDVFYSNVIERPLKLPCFIKTYEN